MTSQTDENGGGNMSFFQQHMRATNKARSTSSAVSSLKSSDPVSLLLEKEDFEPTEEDMTETEHPTNEEGWPSPWGGGSARHTHNEEDYKDEEEQDDDQAVVLTPQQMHAALASILKNNTEKSGFTQNHENENIPDHADADDDGLFTMEMLLELLSEANRPDHYSRRRRLKRPNRNLEVEDLTKILSHINLCEDAEAIPRWDVIYELAYGNHHAQNSSPSIRKGRKHPQEEQEEEGLVLLDVRSSGSSRLGKLSEKGEKDEASGEPYGREVKIPARRPMTRTASNDTQSLSLGDVMGGSTDENGSAFTLDANTHSVDSSVTWFEGADITEIEITEDELEEFLPSYGNSDDESSKGDSTPPPPPGAGILYTPPPLDFVSLDASEDSLSRCYRRRHPRRYAQTE